jgi:hypothetical protein
LCEAAWLWEASNTLQIRPASSALQFDIYRIDCSIGGKPGIVGIRLES